MPTDEKKIAAPLRFEDIQEGAVYAFDRRLTYADGLTFAGLTGDYNPLHLDAAFAAKTPFQKPIVHGMLAGSLFSAMVGMICPGRDSLFLSQQMQFRKPIFWDEEIHVQATVQKKSESIRLVVLKLAIYCRNELVMDGEAKIKMLVPENAS